ncbi:MAG: DnaD domain protein [Weeping tea tree witches'-broom phytoplasma]|uniref:DnaD domain protein n=1 Tax=Candidatus Phytoplasma melaleucae TaxID=2982630 RepID=UPI0029399B18|nr:DnaD domain protein [Weeping tea tree witches'-broom phytoplasma]
MIKLLYEKGVLNIEKILISEYKNINLDLSELTVLLFLFSCYEQKIFSSTVLAQYMNLSKNEVESILERLIKKNFFSLLQSQKNDKMIEIFNLDGTFVQLEKVYIKKQQQAQLEKQDNSIASAIDYLEDLKGRILTSNELEIVKSWYLDPHRNHQDITQAIKQAVANNKNSIHYIDSLLNFANYNLNTHYDDEDNKMLYKFFQQIQK